jgi:hypothetical protein
MGPMGCPGSQMVVDAKTVTVEGAGCGTGDECEGSASLCN